MHALVADGYVVGESRRNIDVKFPEAVGDFESLLAECGIFSEVCAPLAGDIAADLTEKDQPVLAATIQHRCHVLVTSDKTHFGPLYGQRIKGLMIHSPASLARQLELK